MNSTQVQQIFREHYHNYGINIGIVLLSPGDYKRAYEGTGSGLCCKKYERNAGGVQSHFPVQLSTTATLKSLKQKR